MNLKTAIITVTLGDKDRQVDMEVPLDISASELCYALYETYFPDISYSLQRMILRGERPIALLLGERTLGECGVREGSIVHLNLPKEN